MALWIQRRTRAKKPAANAFCFSTKSLTRCWPELGDQADDSPALKTESSALNEGHGRQWNSSFWGLAVVRPVNHLRVTPNRFIRPSTAKRPLRISHDCGRGHARARSAGTRAAAK